MLPSRYFSDLTQPEIAAQLKKNPLVILPAAASSSTARTCRPAPTRSPPTSSAHAVAERMDGLVLPATPFGVTPMHMPFEGTITLTPDTYMRVVTETCVSTAKHGAKRLMIINWHEGNIPSLAIAAESLHREHGMSVLTVQACYVAEELYGHSCDGLTHGGEIEALAVLAHRPDLVHLDRIDYSSDHSHGHKMDKLRRTRSYQPVLTDIRSIAPTGWFGSPQHATAEKGQRMLTDIADAIAEEARDIFRQLDAVQGGTARDQATAAGGLMARLLETIRGEEAGPARPHLARAGVGRDRLARHLPHRRDCGAQAGRPAARPAPAPTASRNASTCSRAPAMTVAESGEIPIKPGDIVLIPPNEKHMTRNTGTEPLVLLCFFAEPDVTSAHRRSSQSF